MARSSAYVIFAVAMCAGAVSAQPKTRTLILVVSGLDDVRYGQALRERLQGQLSDLPVRLRDRLHGSTAPGPVAAAGVTVANLDVEIYSESMRLRLVAEPATDAILAALPVGSKGELSSSQLEALALVVRLAVQALLHEEPVIGMAGPARGDAHATHAGDLERPTFPRAPLGPAGGPLRPTTEPTEPEPEPAEREPAEPEPAEREPAEPGRSIAVPSAQAGVDGWRATLSLAPCWTMDGSGAAGRIGARLALGLDLPVLWFGLGAIGGLPTVERDGVGVHRVARHGLDLSVMVPVVRLGRTSLGAGAAIALFAYRRTSVSQSERFTATPAAWTASIAVSPGLRLRWGEGRLGVMAQAAMEVMPSPPRFAYSKSSQTPDPAQVPRVALALSAAVVGRLP